MRKLFPYLKTYRLQIGLGPFFKLIEAIIELILPLLMAVIIDRGINGNDPNTIWRYGSFMLILVVLAVIVSFSCQYMASVASQGVGTRLREALFSRVNRMSQTELQHYGTASLINRVNGDVNQIQVLVAMTIRLLSRSPVLAIGGVIMSFYINWRLAFILLLVVPVAGILLFLIMRASTNYMKRALVQSDKVTELFTDNIAGARVIRAFAREEHERGYFAKKADQLTQSWIVANAISALMNPLTNLLFNGVIVFIIWQSGPMVNTGSMTQGEVLALVNYLSQIVAALMVWANLASLFPRAFAAGDRISKLLDEVKEPEVIEEELSKGTIANVDAKLDLPLLSVKNLNFTYPETRTAALEGLNFQIRPGEELGVIGATGSGKSTLAKLLSGMYPVEQNQFKFLSVDRQDWSLKAYRQQVSFVPQYAVLFKGTIRSNLYFGMNEKEQNVFSNQEDAFSDPLLEEQMWQALEAAQAADFVREMDGGLDARVERGGLNLSGGQRQRLSIARALMRPAKLYIFDDSSSALDYLTDANMRKAVKRFTEKSGAAVIRISNRVYQLIHADSILVLDNGKQVALGAHEELLETSAIYKEIALSQEGGIHAKRKN